MSARDEILSAVRSALSGVTPAVDVPAAPRVAARDDLVDLFVERVEDYRAVVTRCAPTELAEVVDRVAAPATDPSGPASTAVPAAAAPSTRTPRRETFASRLITAPVPRPAVPHRGRWW